MTSPSWIAASSSGSRWANHESGDHQPKLSLGLDATLVRYTGEGHGIRRPRHRLDYNKRIFDWFERHLK